MKCFDSEPKLYLLFIDYYKFSNLFIFKNENKSIFKFIY